jgi:hypothetical protein
MDQPEAGREDREHEEIHRRVVGQVDQAEEFAPRHALQTVLAAGKRQLHREEEDELGQRQGDHRQIDPGAPDRQGPEDPAEGRRHRATGQDRELGREAVRLAQPRAYIGCRTEERRVAEREQAGKAEQEVEGAREQREAQHLHQEGRVQDERGHQAGRNQQRITQRLA